MIMSDTHSVELPFVRSHAFIIGINDYKYITPLTTAVSDAKGIAGRLEAQHGYTVHPPLLDAGRADIMLWLTETLPRLVGPEDRILLYFAGHGIALDSEEGPGGYLVPADARPGVPDSLISMDVFHKALSDLPCRHGLLILDCCFAGTFKWSSGYRGLMLNVPSVIYEERFWRYVKDPAWQVITSAAYDQQAVDVLTNRSLGCREDNSGQHSPFARALFEALEGKGDVIPQGEGDGVITATELYLYLRDQVESETTRGEQRQTPSLFTLARHDKGEFIFLHPRHRLNLPPAPDRNPFKGLSSFDEADATLFYGRDRVIEALQSRVVEAPLLVVSGASGTGKSSVVKAGLLPRLRREGWQVLPVIRPGKEPKATLDTELPDVEKQLPENGQAVLVIDQYEELITQCEDPAQRRAFESQLAEWLKAFPTLRVILSLRSDFEPQFEDSPLQPWWAAGRYVVPPFSLEEWREIIVKPANQEVLFYEPEDLVDRLVEAVSQAPGALPLLSFTLSELYEVYLKSGREDRALIEADYEQLGGVIGALRTRADETYNGLDEAHQNSMRRLMLRMVAFEGGELAGKRVHVDELQFSNPNETERVAEVAQQLVAARLVLRGADGQGRGYIEPAHDALVRAWARLWEWVKATGEEKLSLHFKLAQAVKDYEAEKEPKKARPYLWNDDPRLDLLRAELQEKGHGLNAREEAFVRSSVARRERNRRRNWSIALGVIAGLTGLSIFAFTQQGLARQSAREVTVQRDAAIRERDRADSTARVAVANNLATQSVLMEPEDPTIALRLAERSIQLDAANTNGNAALMAAFFRESQPGVEFFYQQVDQMPEAPAAEDFPDRYRAILQARQEQFPNLANWGLIAGHVFSGSGNHAILFHQDQHGPYSVELWDYQNLQRKFRQEVGENGDIGFSPASFSRDEKWVAIPNRNHVELYGLDNFYQPPILLKGPGLTGQALIDDATGMVYAQTMDGAVYAWDLRRFSMPKLGRDNAELESVFCDPAGEKFVLKWYGEENVEIWNKKGKRTALADEGESLRLAPDASAILSGSEKMLDLASYSDLLSQKNSEYRRGAITRDTAAGEYGLAIDNRLKTVEVQALDGSHLPVTLKGHDLWIESVAVSPDGRFILTTSTGEIKLWDWNGNNYFSLDYGGRAGFLPDGKTIFVMETPYMEYYEVGSIRLLGFDPEEILNGIEGKDIYQLSEEDRRRFGVK